MQSNSQLMMVRKSKMREFRLRGSRQVQQPVFHRSKTNQFLSPYEYQAPAVSFLCWKNYQHGDLRLFWNWQNQILGFLVDNSLDKCFMPTIVYEHFHYFEDHWGYTSLFKCSLFPCCWNWLLPIVDPRDSDQTNETHDSKVFWVFTLPKSIKNIYAFLTFPNRQEWETIRQKWTQIQFLLQVKILGKLWSN